MFKVTRNGPNRLDIEFSGKLDAEEMKTALDTLEARAEGIENGRMLFVVGDFQLPTMDAAMVEFARLPSMLGFLRKFSRCAVLAEQRWLKMISQIEGALIPGVAIKGFGLQEQAAADEWLEPN
jgi:hypothetical protein